jgi:hypothetical protein
MTTENQNVPGKPEGVITSPPVTGSADCPEVEGAFLLKIPGGVCWAGLIFADETSEHRRAGLSSGNAGVGDINPLERKSPVAVTTAQAGKRGRSSSCPPNAGTQRRRAAEKTNTNEANSRRSLE